MPEEEPAPHPRGVPHGAVKGPATLPDDVSPMKTFGPGSLSGLWALAGAITDAQSFSDQDSENFKYSQYRIFFALKELYFADYTAVIQSLGLPAEDESKLLDQSFPMTEHLQRLLKIYQEEVGRDYKLVVQYQPDKNSDEMWHWDTEAASDTAVTLFLLNRWGFHWEPLVHVQDSNDISEAGMPISTEDEQYGKDPRVTGEAPASVASPIDVDWKDAVTNEDVNADTKLVRLSVPSRKKVEEWSAVQSAYHHNCQIVFQDADGEVKVLPELKQGVIKDDLSINLTISFGSMRLAPFIDLKTTTYRHHSKATSEVLHVGHTRFAFGRLLKTDAVGSDVDLHHHEGITDFQVDTEVFQDAIKVQFTYRHAVLLQMFPDDATRNKMVPKELDLLRRLREAAVPSEPRMLTFKVLLREDEAEMKRAGGTFEFMDFLAGIGDNPCTKLPHYAPYLTRQGFANIQANSMKSIYARISAGAPHMPVKANAAFMDAVEAEVQIGFDVETEWTEQLQLLKQFESTWHWVKFLKIGGNVVALLRVRDRQTLFDPKYLIEPGTELLLKWSSARKQNEQSAAFFVMDDVFSFPDTDLVIVAKNKTAGYFGGDAVAPHRLSRSSFTKASLTILVNDVKYRRRIDATNVVWDAHQGRRDLWPLLLNQSPKDLPVINPFEIAGVDKTVVEAAMAEACSHAQKPLNSEQASVIEGMTKMTGGFQVVQAPGGMGKTMTECMLAHIYFRCNICVVLTAATNAAVQVICEAYAAIFPGSPQPLQIPASNRDLDDEALGRTRRSITGEVTEAISEEVLMMEIVSAMKTTKKTPRGSTANDLLNVAIDAAIKEKFKLLRSYISGVDPVTQEPISEAGEFDMVLELKRFYERSTNPTEQPYMDWDDDDKRHYRQALQFVEEEIVKRAPLIACTTSSCGRKVVRQNAGSNFGAIVIALDEGSRDREADTYIPLAKLQRSPIAMHIFGDVQQGLPVHLSTEAKAHNEFLKRGKLPLMKRLLMQGFPATFLKKQYRMHRLLMAFPNQRFYGSELVTDGEANIPLKPSVENCLREILGFDKDAPGDVLRLSYVQIENSELRVSSNSHSRANLEHVQRVVDAVRKLMLVYGKDTRKKIMVATPYRRQATEYRTAFIHEHRKLKGDTTPMDLDDFPEVRTVDATQGSEAEMVILDLVNIHADRPGDLGHMMDENRACVAFTRAKQVLWIVGGAFRGAQAEIQKPAEDGKDVDPLRPWTRKRLPAVLDYKRSLSIQSRYVKFKKPVLTRPIPHDLDPTHQHTAINDDGSLAAELTCSICEIKLDAKFLLCEICNASDGGYYVCELCRDGGSHCMAEEHTLVEHDVGEFQNGDTEQTEEGASGGGSWGMESNAAKDFAGDGDDWGTEKNAAKDSAGDGDGSSLSAPPGDDSSLSAPPGDGSSIGIDWGRKRKDKSNTTAQNRIFAYKGSAFDFGSSYKGKGKSTTRVLPFHRLGSKDDGTTEGTPTTESTPAMEGTVATEDHVNNGAQPLSSNDDDDEDVEEAAADADSSNWD